MRSCSTAALEVILYIPPLHLVVENGARVSTLDGKPQDRNKRVAVQQALQDCGHLLNLPKTIGGDNTVLRITSQPY